MATPDATAPAPAPGWYLDPSGDPSLVRWWDGQTWVGYGQRITGHSKPGVVLDGYTLAAVILTAVAVSYALAFAPFAFGPGIAGLVVGLMAVPRAREAGQSVAPAWITVGLNACGLAAGALIGGLFLLAAAVS